MSALRRFTKTCLLCGGEARILAPEGSDDLDVMAEFSSAGREVSFVDEGESIGVVCRKCAEPIWRKGADRV